MITEGVTRGEIVKYIQARGFKSMRQESLEKVWNGETSFSEVLKNTI